MLKQIKIIFLTIVVFILHQYNLYSDEYKFYNNYFFHQNDNSFIDSSFKYFSDLGCAHLGVDESNIYLQFKDVDGDSLVYNSINLKFLNVIDSNVIINVEKQSVIQLQYEDENKSIIYNNKNNSYGYLDIRNLYNNVNFAFKFNNGNLDYKLISYNNDLSGIKLKLQGIDSIVHNLTSDSSIYIYSKSKYFILPKIKAIQIDTLRDTTEIICNYVVSNDTLSFYSSSIDTNKVLIIQSESFNNISNYSFDKYDFEGSGYYYKDSILITQHSGSKSIIILKKEYLINDYLRNLTLDSNYKYKINLEKTVNYKIYNNDELSKEMILARINEFDTLEIHNIKANNFDEFILLGTCNFPLSGDFKRKLADTLKYNFQNLPINNIFFKISQLGNIYQTYYLNFFDSTYSDYNFYVDDFIENRYDYYFVGSGKFDNLDSANFYSKKLLKYNKTSEQKGFIVKFNTFYNMILNSAYFGHSGSTGEYLHFNNMIESYDQLEAKNVFYISGLTNSTSILEDSLWDKDESSNDNIIIKISSSLDTIYKAAQIGGANEELNNSMLDYYKTVNKLLKVNDHISFWGITNSNSFYNMSDTNIIKNTKTNSSFDVYGVNLSLNLDFQKLLFVESDEDDFINEIISDDSYIYLHITSRANDFQLSDSLLVSSLDSISLSTTYKKSFFSIITNNLFWENDNILTHKPFWVTYLESIDSDLSVVSGFKVNPDSFTFYLNTKSENIIFIEDYILNSGQSLINEDACKLKIKLY